MPVQEAIAPPCFNNSDAVNVIILSVQECCTCAQLCERVADTYLVSRPVVTQLIRSSLDCAEMCAAAGSIASRRIGRNPAIVKAVLEACAAACRACAAECERHNISDVCRACAAACRRCERACVAAAAEV